MAANPTDLALHAFYQELAAKNMDALWRLEITPPDLGTITAPYGPCLWKWRDLEPMMWKAAELVQPGPEAQRRVIQLVNPELAPSAVATHTMVWNLQLVLPGETAPSHRHTNTAIRFVLRSKGVTTVVNGEPVTMFPGDLVLTPNWHWHGHTNDTDEPAFWIDGLDVPLVGTLRVGLYEEYKERLQKPSSPADQTLNTYGRAQMRPMHISNDSPPFSPLMCYRWEQTLEAMQGLINADEMSPFDDVALEYINPATGGHVLPTLSCHAQMLRSGVHTLAHKHSSSVAYHVFQGNGATIIDGMLFEWEEGDFFVLPPWAWHEHLVEAGKEEAVLLSISDLPVLEALQLHYEVPYERNGGQQEVTGHYEGQPSP